MGKKYPIWVAAAVYNYNQGNWTDGLPNTSFIDTHLIRDTMAWGATSLGESGEISDMMSFFEVFRKAILSKSEEVGENIFFGPNEMGRDVEFRLLDDFKIEDHPIIQEAVDDYTKWREGKKKSQDRRLGFTRVSIEKFKGIDKKISIPLRPITMLFGSNSAGKSTIQHSLLYFREILKTGNCNPGKILNETIDLGIARDLVHKHDLSNEIRIRLDYNFDDDGIDDIDFNWTCDPHMTGSVYNYSLTSAWIELGVYFPASNENEEICMGRVKSYRVWLNGEIWCSLDIGDLGSEVFLNDKHHLIIDSMENGELDNNEEITNELMSILREYNDVIPQGEGKLLVANKDFEKKYSYEHQLLTGTLLKTKQFFIEELDKLVYVGPIRMLPDRAYDCPQRHDPSRWASGIAAWDFYARGERPGKQDQWWYDYLKLGYAIGYDIVREISQDSLLFNKLFNLAEDGLISSEDVSGLYQEFLDQPGKVRIKIVDQKNHAEVQLQDIGTGVSQAVPVVAGALSPDSRIFSVEQPELHLHPAIQCRIADLFIDRANKRANSISLIETHSEHLILRLLRRIRETAENELPPEEKEFHLTPEQVGVFYIEAAQDGTKITELPIAEDGDFTCDWPNGFFEERAGELF
ncbi:MAG: DUF3696 domain-containing protein [Victivallales bacterium]|nr:DUF3696 domain-containing protein [Victivallales bacterium]